MRGCFAGCGLAFERRGWGGDHVWFCPLLLLETGTVDRGWRRRPQAGLFAVRSQILLHIISVDNAGTARAVFCELPPVPGHLMGVPEEECVVVFVSPVFFGRWVVALSACELEPDGSQGSAEVCVGVR